MRVLFLISAFVWALPVHADLVLSEFLAANSGVGLLDEDSEASDWIEIHNDGAVGVSLNGFHLTDDETDLTQWTFPAVSVPANGYLIVFASSKNRVPVVGELHTNFKLSAGGEYLALVDASGAVVDEYAPEYPEQEDNISYGLGPDGVTLGYFVTPTPGAANSVSAAGRVDDTEFSVNRGVYDSSFAVEITSATDGAAIRYTTDGSTPTASSGLVYSSAITINQTTVLRAIAYKAGFFPSNVDTQSYLFPSDVRTQFANGGAPPGWPSGTVNGQVYDYGMDPDITSRYTAQEMEDALTAIPSVMITTDLANLTDASTGFYSNPTESGINWERPGHLEIIGGDLSVPVNSRCGLRVRGGASRAGSNPKHALRAFFRAEYGESKLNHPLFETEGVDEFDKIDFRTAQNYSWSKDGNTSQNTFLRDVLGRDLQGAMGQPYTRSRYCHLYLNGVYWGLFMTQERAEKNWGASYLGGDNDDFDTIKARGRYETDRYDTEATDGDLNGAWFDLWTLAQAQLANPTSVRFNEMQGLDASGQRDLNLPVLLDVDNLIDYILLLGYTGAYDNSLSSFVGASNNWYAVRDSAGERGFVSLLHDGEHSLGAGGSRWNNNNDRINTSNGSGDRANFNKSNPQFVHMDLADSTPEYRLRFADRAHAVLFNDGVLTKDRVLELFEARREIVDQVIIAESARWGDAHSSQTDDPADKENWESAADQLEAVFDTRTETLVGHLRTGGLYPDVDAPTFLPHVEQVLAGSTVQLAAPSGTIYYTTDGSDPRLPDGNPSSAATSIAANGGTTVFPKKSVWSFDDSGTDLGLSSVVVGDPGYDSNNWKHPDFVETAWSSGEGIFGFGALGPNGSTITPDTSMGQGSGPNGSNPRTSYLRRSFNVSGASSVLSLNASVLADDGVIVYLNGAEVYRSNLESGAIAHVDFAQNAVNNGAESAYTAFSIDPALLVEGENVFAAEIHQINSTSSDLGFDLDLSLLDSSSAGYVVNSSTTLNARVLDGNEWSALNSNYYSVGSTPLPGDLVISEVHYHPSEPSSAAELAVSSDDGDFEFIELTNVSQKDLELRGVQLAEQVINDHLEGVKFTFEGVVLSPGQRITVVADRAAFSARYPSVPDSGIGGEFEGGLGNSGEWLELQNAEGTVIASFRYNDVDPWPTEADGGGESLQLVSLDGAVDYSDPLSWMAIADNGSPSDAGSGLFSGVATADLDGDGVSALYEYFAGTNDSDGVIPESVCLERMSAAEGGGAMFSFTRDPETIGVNGELEQSEELVSWGAPPAGSSLVSRVALPGNLVRETYHLPEGVPSYSKLFVRMSVSLDN